MPPDCRLLMDILSPLGCLLCLVTRSCSPLKNVQEKKEVKTCYRHVDMQPKVLRLFSNHSTLSGANRVPTMCSSKFSSAASVTRTSIKHGTSGAARFSRWSPDTKSSGAWHASDRR